MTRKGRKGGDDCAADDLALRSAIDAIKVDLMKELKTISGTLNSLQNKINDVENTLQKVLETQRTQEVEIRNLKQEVLIMKENYDNILAEVENRERRRTNLIISGLPEKEGGSADERKENDLTIVKSLLSKLDSSKDMTVSAVFRIGKLTSSRPRLLKVVCSDAELKRSILSKSKDLRNLHQYKNIYINPDLTPLQQAQNKKLREELRARRNLGEDVTIRHGKIVRKISGQNFQ